MTDTDYLVAAVVEQQDGSYIIQLMEECDPEDDPHGDGARLADEVTVAEVL